MTYQGVLTKMKTQFGSPIAYYLVFKEDFIHVNSLIGKEIRIEMTGYECLECHQPKEIFRQGFCKNWLNY